MADRRLQALGGAVWRLDFAEGGTCYRLVVWRQGPPGASVGVAWPDVRWSVGDLSAHAAPNAGWLTEHGLRAGDARVVAGALTEVWPVVTR